MDTAEPTSGGDEKVEPAAMWTSNCDAANRNVVHGFDESRMPICSKFIKYGQCRKPNCMYKHKLEDKECISYSLGFCPRGNSCPFNHKKLPGPPPPVQEVFKRLRQLGEGRGKQAECAQVYFIPEGTSRYFIIKSENLKNLKLSIERGVWATIPRNEDILNEAFGTCDNVILIFSVNDTHGIQGCAKMKSFIGVVPGRPEIEWKGRNGLRRKYGKCFLVQWIKVCELPFNKTRRLKNPYNENLPVQMSRDCQELEPSIGKRLISLIFQEKNHPFLRLRNGIVDYGTEKHEYVKYGL